MKKLCVVLAMLFVFVLPLQIFAAGDETGTWVVKLKPGVELPTTSTMRLFGGDEALEPLSEVESEFYVTEDESVIAMLKEQGLVEYAEESGLSYLSVVPNDPFYGKPDPVVHTKYQYALEMLEAEKAWDVTTGKENINVVVIDSGFDYNHEDGANIKAGKDYVNHGINTKDYGDHGTLCSGIIGATMNNGVGIAGASPDCTVTMLRCFFKKNKKMESNNGIISAAIRDAVDIYDADVISMSFGSIIDNKFLKEAIDYASGKGAILVAATGNNNKNGPLEYPAAYPNVIGVGAVNVDKNVADYSSQNPSTFVVAPGTDILSLAPSATATSNQYAIGKGTSFATPYVSSLAALAKSIDPAIDSADFSSLLKLTVEDLGTPGYDVSYGYGLINYATYMNKMVNYPFIDVIDSEWYAKAVYSLKNEGVISGRTNYMFYPADNTKRSEFVMMLAQMSKVDFKKYKYPSKFKDVPSDSWYNACINWAVENEIVHGVTKDEFHPEALITRQEIAKILDPYLAKMNIILEVKNEGITFSDSQTMDDWAKNEVMNLARTGIINGFPDGKFYPKAKATRAEASMLLDNTMKQ